MQRPQQNLQRTPQNNGLIDPNKLSSMYVIEGIGSFFIVLVIHISHFFQFKEFAISFAYLIGNFLSAKLSIGYQNSAVAMTLFLDLLKSDRSQEKEEQSDKFYKAILAQIIGGVLAGFFASYLQGSANLAYLPFQEHLSFSEAFLMEFIFSIFLCLTACVLNISYPNIQPMHKAVLLTSCIFVSYICIGEFTGGFINPSVGVSIGIIRLFTTGNPEEFNKTWLYVLAPCCGAFVAHTIYLNIVKPYEQALKDAENKSGDKYIALPEIVRK